jgi:hypothetical protein
MTFKKVNTALIREVGDCRVVDDVPQSQEVSFVRVTNANALRTALKELKARRNEINEGFIRDVTSIESRQLQTIDDIISMIINVKGKCKDLTNVDFDKGSYRILLKFKFEWIRVVTFECVEIPGYRLKLQFVIRRDPKKDDSFFYGIYPYMKCERVDWSGNYLEDSFNEGKSGLLVLRSKLKEIGFY